MERERKDILISDLIYKSLRGSLKGDEADILDAWLEKPENRAFFMEYRFCFPPGKQERRQTKHVIGSSKG